MEEPIPKMDSKSGFELLLIQEVKVEFEPNYSEEISPQNPLLETEAIPSEVKIKLERLSDDENTEMKENGVVEDSVYSKTENKNEDFANKKIKIEIVEVNDKVDAEENDSDFDHNEMIRVALESRMAELNKGSTMTMPGLKLGPEMMQSQEDTSTDNKIEIEIVAIDAAHGSRMIKPDPDTPTEPIRRKKPSKGQRNQKKPPRQCTICSRIFSKESHLQRHKLTHTESKEKLAPKIRLWEKVVDDKGRKLYGCIVCKKTFTRKSYAEEHIRTHTGERPHECNVCKKTFTHKNTFQKHMVIHTGESPHKCDICNRIFPWKGHLRNHMMKHTGEKPYDCTICKKSFAYKYSMQQHMLIHTGEKPHECSVCQKTFSQRSSLHQHALTHTGEKPHECPVCKKAFNQKNNLRKHMMIHLGEAPHECEICKRRFRKKNCLRVHMLTHTGENPHECNVCKKIFNKRSGLLQHTLTHTGEKPHECYVCQKKFTQKSSLQRHVLIHMKVTNQAQCV